jgi:amidase
VVDGRDVVAPNLVGATALQIAHAVQRGDVSATGVVADHIDHARVADRVLDSLRVLRDSAAIAEAEKVDEQPDLANLGLAGVPVLVQENTPVAGLPTWNGSAAVRTTVAEFDHEVVRRLRGAGAVVLGVGRMSELGLWAAPDDAAGRSRNPWRTDRSSGGSSGGCAAAVAAGVVPVAQAVDGLGSVRVGAAACGVIGFKPGRGVIPYDIGTTDWFGLADHGLLGTNVADVTAGLAVLAGWTGPAAAGGAGWAVEPTGRVRVAMSMRCPVPGVAHDDDARTAVRLAARLLVGRGHDVVTADPAYPRTLAAATMATWLAIAHGESAAVDPDGLQPRTRRHAALGALVRGRGLVADRARADWRKRCVSWFADGGFDLMVLPAIPTAPPPAVQWSARSWRVNVAASLRNSAYTAAWNLAGLPAVVVPMGLRRDGLPASVQLVGPPGAESLLLAVARQWEQDAPWRSHAPTWPRTPFSPRRRNGRAVPGAALTTGPALETTHNFSTVAGRPARR